VTDEVVTPPSAPEGRDGLCGARKRQGDGTCTQVAGWGTPHPGSGRCKLHGGNTRGQVTKARNEQVAAEVSRLGLSVETTPTAALQDALNRAQSDVIALGAKVALLDPEGWVQRERGQVVRDEVSAWLKAYWSALDRLAGIASKCVSLGIEAAAVSVLAAHADQLVRVLQQVLAALGHDPAAPDVVDVVTRALRSVEGEVVA